MPFGQSNFGLPGGGGFDFGGLIETGIGIIGDIFNPQQQQRIPGFPLQPQPQQAPRQLPTDLGGMLQEQLGLGSGGLAQSGCQTVPFNANVGQRRATPVRFVQANPGTGKPTWFGPLGTPILFSGDLAACRRVERAAKRADKALKRRRPR